MILPTCKELIDFLDDYVEGRLPLHRRLAFETHLLGCRDCRVYLRSYKSTIALTKESGEARASPPMPPDLTRAILDALSRADAS
jgi:anti-sigma factor RsiW